MPLGGAIKPNLIGEEVGNSQPKISKGNFMVYTR